jgi:peroxiredoxin
MSSAGVDPDLLANTPTSAGESLAALSEKSPVLLVLLRHEGCPFCRNAMSDMARVRDRIEGAGTRIVLGHMGSTEEFAVFSARYGLSSLAHVADPGCTLYRGLGLRRGTLLQMLGPRLWWNWVKAVLKGHMAGRIKGDVFQLPGAFLLHQGKVVRGHAYRDASDRPDYMSLAVL